MFASIFLPNVNHWLMACFVSAQKSAPRAENAGRARGKLRADFAVAGSLLSSRERLSYNFPEKTQLADTTQLVDDSRIRRHNEPRIDLVNYTRWRIPKNYPGIRW